VQAAQRNYTPWSPLWLLCGSWSRALSLSTPCRGAAVVPGVGAGPWRSSASGASTDGFLREVGEPCEGHAPFACWYVTPTRIGGVIERLRRFAPTPSCCEPAFSHTGRDSLRECSQSVKGEAAPGW